MELEELLAHAGVKGMKWGVRKDKGHEGQRAKTKKIARLDKKFARRAQSETVIFKIYNGAVKTTNAKLHLINDKPQYKNADLTRDTPLRRKYYKEHHMALIDSLEASANALGTNASGTKKYGIADNNDHWDVVLRDVKHADTDEIAFTVKVGKDAMGHIISLLIEDDSMAQSDDFEDFIEHFGVKGMKWGVKRNRAQLDASEDHTVARAAKAKVKQGGTKALSNKELQDIITRMNLEQQFSRLNPSKVKKTGEVIKTVFSVGRTVNDAISFVNSPAGKIVRDGIKSKVKKK
jgi:hypothetical protein